MIKLSASVLVVLLGMLFSIPSVLADENDSAPDATHSTMVGTPDGGALVLYGHTLTKYDSDLEVSKVVDVRESAKPKKGELPSGDDLVMHAHHSSSSSYSTSSSSGVRAFPKLSEDKPETSSPTIAEPSSDLQSNSGQH